MIGAGIVVDLENPKVAVVVVDCVSEEFEDVVLEATVVLLVVIVVVFGKSVLVALRARVLVVVVDVLVVAFMTVIAGMLDVVRLHMLEGFVVDVLAVSFISAVTFEISILRLKKLRFASAKPQMATDTNNAVLDDMAATRGAEMRPLCT